MTIKLTPASFVLGVRQSGLIDSRKLDAVLAEMERNGVDQHDAGALAAALVQRGIITEWQSEKLLQGRHKGFILGRYKLLSLLGAGEMSAVYLAEHTLLERRCAIKVLPGNRVKDTSYLGRFHREAKAVASLNHPNIVRAYDVDQQFDGGAEIHFLVMEYVEGKNLEKIVSTRGPLPYITATDYIRQAAEGLSHAHQAGLVHRDIKPENVLVDAQGTVKILDLGLARLFEQTDEESLTIKHDEKVLGTADYLAPEQAIDSHKVDARADIYSLGCTLYFALTGHPPFTEGTLVQRLFAHQTKSPRAVKEERTDAPDSLMAILDKMMAKKSADRYQTAAELADVLTRWLVDNGGQAWKSSHLSLVATIYGLDALTRGVAANQASMAMPAAVSAASPGSQPHPETRTDNAGSPAPSGHSGSEPQSKPRKVTRTEQEQKEIDRRRRLKQRAMQSAASTAESFSASETAVAIAEPPRSPSAMQTAPTETRRSGIMTAAAMTAPRIRSWIADPLQSQTRWMVTWVGLAALAMICISAFLMWFYQNNFPTTRQSEAAQPAAMVLGALTDR